MDDLIERKEAIEAIKKYGKDALSARRRTFDPVDDIVELCNMLAALPAVEATPVVHGRCIRCGAKMDVEGGCRMTEKPCIMPEMPYCPACKYGLIVPIDETECEWKCLYDGSGLL